MNTAIEHAEKRYCPMALSSGISMFCKTTDCMAWRKLVRIKDGIKTFDPKLGRCGMVQNPCAHEITLCQTRS